MRIYFSLFFLLVSLSAFSAIDRGRVDSLKTLVASSLKDNDVPDTLSINRLNTLAENYFNDNPDSTLYYGKKCIALSRKINYKAGIANGLVQTAHVYYFGGKYHDAIKNFNEAIGIYKSINDYRDLGKCYTLYGRMYNLLADYKSALSYLNLAAEMNRKAGNEADEADTYKNIGIVYFSEGQLPAALDYYYKALFIDLKLHNMLAAAANYNDIGFVLYDMEMYPKALEYYKKALSLFKGSNHLLGIGTVTQNIGEVLLAQQSYDKAISFLEKSRRIAIKQDDKEGLSSIYTDLGLCYAHKGEFKQAISYLDTSLNIARKFKIIYNEAYTLIGFATAYNLQKDFKNAYKYAIEGQQLAVKLGNLSVRSNAALQLNKTLAGLGKFDVAYTLLRQYIELRDSLNNDESIQKLTSYNADLNFRDKHNQLMQQEHEREILFQQGKKQQKLLDAIFITIILGMIGISTVYYRQKLKQQKINRMLEEKNTEVSQQKTDLNDQALKLNDLNTLKDRLISVLAHDLRAPLSTLRGLFGLLLDDTITHRQLLDMIPSVLKKLEYTSDFLDTLLFWINSQMENFDGSVKSFSLKEIICFEVENYHEQAAAKGITLIYRVPEDIMAWADQNSIRIVIRNLVTNAIKFSNRGDVVEVSAVPHDEHSHLITVKDTGTGMSAEQLSKLFKSKVNSKAGTNNESGTGMGMLFCKDLIERCNGKIWVNSSPGNGTSFFFTLPIGNPVESAYHLAS